jgi:p-cumate 2,3-dioxygenase beta subunit
VDLEKQQQIEQFLYREAELLDEWRLEEWLALFAAEASYIVPATSGGRPGVGAALALVSDDRTRLAGRVERLLNRLAHASSPHPRTRHLVTNVRATQDGTLWTVRANFVLYSMRNRQTNLYMGEYRYRLRAVAGSFLIEEKIANLDMESLEPAGGKVNIVI